MHLQRWPQKGIPPRQLNIPDDQLKPVGTFERRGDIDNTDPVITVDKDAAEHELGHAFNATQDDINEIKDAITSGHVTALGDYISEQSDDRFLASFNPDPNKIIISIDPLNWANSPVEFSSIVTNGAIE